MTDLSPFHLAIPVKDLDETLSFYEGCLQCARGRESGNWVDLNFLGHQLVLCAQNSTAPSRRFSVQFSRRRYEPSAPSVAPATRPASE